MSERAKAEKLLKFLPPNMKYSEELAARLEHLYTQVQLLLADRDPDEQLHLQLWFSVAVNSVIEQVAKDASIS